jgi:putative peptidoglycan lipid II flippase
MDRPRTERPGTDRPGADRPAEARTEAIGGPPVPGPDRAGAPPRRPSLFEARHDPRTEARGDARTEARGDARNDPRNEGRGDARNEAATPTEAVPAETPRRPSLFDARTTAPPATAARRPDGPPGEPPRRPEPPPAYRPHARTEAGHSGDRPRDLPLASVPEGYDGIDSPTIRLPAPGFLRDLPAPPAAPTRPSVPAGYARPDPPRQPGRYLAPGLPGAGPFLPPGIDPPTERLPTLGPGPYRPPVGRIPTTGQPTRPPEHAEPSLGRSSRIMAIATAASRLTGFLRSLAIAAAIGLGLVGDAYNTANTLPNIVYELLLGGVLTSVVIPLLVHAQERDPDQGEAYTQRLMSLATVALAAATFVAVLAAPLLTAVYVGSDSPKAHLTTVFAWLLLPEIFFYGLGAMFGAILNTRNVYGAPAWAPVLNNLVVIATAIIFVLLPGPAKLLPGTITSAQVLVLGVGTTFGIFVQALVLLPALRRVGFQWRWRLDVRGARLGEAGGLASWVLGYVAISQVGYIVVTRLANEVNTAGRGYAVFTNASLLFQMPYGILGVSLLTALMPRMSRAAARGDTVGVVSDLTLGSRLTALTLVPVTAAFTVLGPAIGVVIYAHGATTGDEARQVGVVLGSSAFGLVPFALTMLQLRVFYAVKDAKTPTLINVGMVVAKIAMAAIVPMVLPDRHIVLGLAVATSLSYVVGVAIGEVLLRKRFGELGTRLVIQTTARLTVLSIIGGLAAWGVYDLVTSQLGQGVGGSAVSVLLGSIAGLVVLAAVASKWHVEEFRELIGALRSRGGTPVGPRGTPRRPMQPPQGPARGPARPVGRVPLQAVQAERSGRSSGGRHRAR